MASLEELADRLEYVTVWDALRLPRATKTALQTICEEAHRHYTVPRDATGTDDAPQTGGLTALFAGPRGTGKRLAARSIARELLVDLYRVDLASFVTKYIGETEKQLDRLFEAAAEQGVILFFDEADALFGKRTDVTASHERFANIEVNYLLQRAEAFPGLLIFSAASVAGCDQVLLNRLCHVVEFSPGTSPRHAATGLLP